MVAMYLCKGRWKRYEVQMKDVGHDCTTQAACGKPASVPSHVKSQKWPMSNAFRHQYEGEIAEIAGHSLIAARESSGHYY